MVKNPARFGKPVDDGDLNELISEAIPPNTKKSTSWAMKVFDEWQKSRNENGEVIPELAVFTVEDVNHWLTRFIVEVRKLNADFIPQSLCICLLLGFYEACVSKGTPTTL